MRISLVTGGAGFIGSHLVEALLARGRKVIVLDDLSTGNIGNLDTVRHHPQLQVVLDSISNEDHLRHWVNQADEIYHLAAVVGVQLVLRDPARTAAINVNPIETILAELARHPRPLFLASTSEVYGKNPRTPLREDDDLLLGPTAKSRWIYACSKALDEYLALAEHAHRGIPVTIGRFFNVVGPRQIGRYGMVVPRFVEQARQGGPVIVHGDGQQIRCFAHVHDVVRGILALMECPAAVGKVFNLGSDSPITIRQLAETVINVVDPRVSIQHIPYEQAYSPGYEDIRCRIPDLTRLRQTIAHDARLGLEDIIRDVIDWQHRMLASQTAVPDAPDAG